MSESSSSSSKSRPTTSKPSSSPLPLTLPPGMVLGPDGKPCKICTAFRNWRPTTTTASSPGITNSNNNNNKKPKPKSTAVMMAALASGAGFQPLKPDKPDQDPTLLSPLPLPLPLPPPPPPQQQLPQHCPPDVESLGRATWSFLHTTAAYYPTHPTPSQRANMLNLIHALPALYPCTHCATDFGNTIKANPPDVSGRERLSRWFCERHNEVNERLGKGVFDCEVGKVDERWRDGPGDGSCDS